MQVILKGIALSMIVGGVAILWFGLKAMKGT